MNVGIIQRFWSSVSKSVKNWMNYDVFINKKNEILQILISSIISNCEKESYTKVIDENLC